MGFNPNLRSARQKALDLAERDRLGGLNLSASSLGLPIGIVYGRTRIPTNLVYANNFVAIPHFEETRHDAGKGGGAEITTVNVHYTYEVAAMLAVCEGPIVGYGTLWADKARTTPDGLGMTQFLGTRPQSPWAFLTTSNPPAALHYPGLAYLAHANLSLGSTNQMPNITVEVNGFLSAGNCPIDVNPEDVLSDLLTATHYGAGFPVELIGDWTDFHDYCHAACIRISPAYISQQPMSEIATAIAAIGNSELVWSDGVLKIVPYCDDTIIGGPECEPAVETEATTFNIQNTAYGWTLVNPVTGDIWHWNWGATNGGTIEVRDFATGNLLTTYHPYSNSPVGGFSDYEPGFVMDATHVYFLDDQLSNRALVKHDLSDGDPIAKWGGVSGEDLNSVVINQNNGDIWVGDNNNFRKAWRINKASIAGAYLETITWANLSVGPRWKSPFWTSSNRMYEVDDNTEVGATTAIWEHTGNGTWVIREELDDVTYTGHFFRFTPRNMPTAEGTVWHALRSQANGDSMSGTWHLAAIARYNEDTESLDVFKDIANWRVANAVWDSVNLRTVITTTIIHDMPNNTSVQFSGMAGGGWTALNGNRYTITRIDDFNFHFSLDSSSFGTYNANSGFVRDKRTMFDFATNADHPRIWWNPYREKFLVNLAHNVAPATLTFGGVLYEMEPESFELVTAVANFRSEMLNWSTFPDDALAITEDSCIVAQQENTPIRMTKVCIGSGGSFSDDVTFTPDTTIRANLTDDDFLHDDDEDPVRIKRDRLADAYNSVRIEILDRDSDYNTYLVEVADQAAIEQFGYRPMSVIKMHEICDIGVGRRVAQTLLQRLLYYRVDYEFRLGWSHSRLEVMDLVTLTEESLGLNNTPVRVKSIDEDDEGTLTYHAEDFMVGVSNPGQYATQARDTGFVPNIDEDPGDTNAPLYFVPSAAVNEDRELVRGWEMWIGASGGPEWGGCQIWISRDNGNSYSFFGTLDAPARHGTLTANITVGGTLLKVNMSGSNGVLNSVTGQNANDIANLSVILDLTPNNHEVVTFSSAQLTAPFQYDLTLVKRGLFCVPASNHTTNANFLRLDGAVKRFMIPPTTETGNVLVKLPAFNRFRRQLQSLDGLAEYNVQISLPPESCVDPFLAADDYAFPAGVEAVGAVGNVVVQINNLPVPVTGVEAIGSVGNVTVTTV